MCPRLFICEGKGMAQVITRLLPFHCSLKCGSWTANGSITWKLVRNTNHQAPSQSSWNRNSRVGPNNLCFNKLSRWYRYNYILRTIISQVHGMGLWYQGDSVIIRVYLLLPLEVGKHTILCLYKRESQFGWSFFDLGKTSIYYLFQHNHFKDRPEKYFLNLWVSHILYC